MTDIETARARLEGAQREALPALMIPTSELQEILEAAVDSAGPHWPRIITTIDQLELLKVGSVVLDDYQTAFQRADEYDDENETDSLWTRDSDLLFPPFHIILPALLLWEPGT